MDDEVKEKVDYLKEEILDKNYDKQSFINFCLTKKEKGDDLNSWTLNELKLVVREFVVEQNNDNKDNNNNKDNNENKDNNQILMKDFNNEFKNLEKEINCRKLFSYYFNSQKNINIKVINPKEMNGPIFGKNYVLYEIETEPYYWKVYRTYEDFVTLRKLLIKYFPYYYIPPLPKENYTEKQFYASFVNKRMKGLNTFLNKLMEREEFKSCSSLYAFLSYENRKNYENKIKEYQNEIISTKVEDYKTLDGKLKISLSESNEKIFLNVNKYFRLQDEILGKLNTNLKNFHKNLNNTYENLNDVCKNFELLELLNKRVLMKPIIIESLEKMKDFFKIWKKVLIMQNEKVKDYIKNLFKEIKIEGKAYIELIEKREELKNKCSSENQKLLRKKEKLFKNGDINKFEVEKYLKNIEKEKCSTIDKERLLRDKNYAFRIICEDDNDNLKNMYYQLGYANKMNLEELKDIIKGYCSSYIENIKKFSEEFYETINYVIHSWSLLEIFISSSKKKLNEQINEVSSFI